MAFAPIADHLQLRQEYDQLWRDSQVTRDMVVQIQVDISGLNANLASETSLQHQNINIIGEHQHQAENKKQNWVSLADAK